ncbi:hypothetical protein QBD01_002829 [Ochrobactrum sp. 19YEA23]|nr:hypothetical protein [Ochrobactrum sp. RH2CCR150]MDH7786808.1 hypothetical protein [Ochrobactrum sp. 19YEA23]
MNKFISRTGYFIGLWLVGVAAVSIVGLIIRAILN